MTIYLGNKKVSINRNKVTSSGGSLDNSFLPITLKNGILQPNIDITEMKFDDSITEIHGMLGEEYEDRDYYLLVHIFTYFTDFNQIKKVNFNNIVTLKDLDEFISGIYTLEELLCPNLSTLINTKINIDYYAGSEIRFPKLRYVDENSYINFYSASTTYNIYFDAVTIEDTPVTFFNDILTAVNINKPVLLFFPANYQEAFTNIGLETKLQIANYIGYSLTDNTSGQVLANSVINFTLPET